MNAAIAKQNEPTMDEILASIRKIISEDLGDAATVAQANGRAVNADSSADILELSPQMALPSSRDAAWNTPLGQRDSHGAPERRVETSNAPVIDPVTAVTELAARMAIVSARADKGSVDAEPLAAAPVAPSTETAVSSAFGALRQNIERENSTDAAISSAMRTVVEASLRPMLKDWLDSHLPTIVERLVKAEIERMAKRG